MRSEKVKDRLQIEKSSGSIRSNENEVQGHHCIYSNFINDFDHNRPILKSKHEKELNFHYENYIIR